MLVIAPVILLCVIAMAVAGALVVVPKAGELTEKRSLCADFTDSVGLYRGNTVALMGVKIGNVTSITPEGDHVRVLMKVDPDLDLAADVGAVTIDSAIVTDRRVELTKPYTGGPRFAAGCIDMSRTKTPRGISETLDTTNNLLSSLLGTTPTERPDALKSGEIGDLLETVDGQTRGRGPQIRAMLSQLSTTIGDPQETDSVMRRLIDNLDGLGQTFVDAWPDFATAVNTLNQSAITFSGFAREFAQAIDLAVDFLPVIARNLSKYQDRILALADLVVPVVHLVAARAGDIKDILEQLPAVGGKLSNLYDKDRKAGRIFYHPPQFEISTKSVSEVCTALPVIPNCPRSGDKGDVIDLGLVQLILGSAGWR